MNVSGPPYETPAEGRFLRAAGANVVLMSTVPEVMVAKEEGMEVLVLSLVTNKVVILEFSGRSMPAVVDETVSHEEVLAIGSLKADVMKMLVEKVQGVVMEVVTSLYSFSCKQP
ncbi:hypothetical protein D9757_012016 [Collybiopsis confluens]|uniref:purine-nucleoside phosphorylase n=1 Tax=Collybiopsis confluens TaxID=2823264 RepID=A0A8H5GSM9_9AGAR|nr:hypothetical protein D9757_012016 [Collybiopsis confluens]